MKKWLYIFISVGLLLALYVCLRPKAPEPLEVWDCSVLCAEESSASSYVVTYSDQEIIPTKGALTFQNSNDFDIVIHLLAEGEKERVGVISPYGVSIFYQIKNDIVYTVGCHADVAADTEIHLLVYNGEGTNPYSLPPATAERE